MGKRRKTRQEKIIAQLRRKLETTQRTKWEMTRLSARQGNEKSFDSELRTAELQEYEVRIPSLTSISLIKKDLIKTTALAALAISLEVVLFFLLG